MVQKDRMKDLEPTQSQPFGDARDQWQDRAVLYLAGEMPLAECKSFELALSKSDWQQNELIQLSNSFVNVSHMLHSDSSEKQQQREQPIFSQADSVQPRLAEPQRLSQRKLSASLLACVVIAACLMLMVAVWIGRPGNPETPLAKAHKRMHRARILDPRAHDEEMLVAQIWASSMADSNLERFSLDESEVLLVSEDLTGVDTFSNEAFSWNASEFSFDGNEDLSWMLAAFDDETKPQEG